MAQPESRLSRKIMTAIRAEGHFCFKVHGSEYMMAGLPDIIVCANGLFIGLETKMPGEEDDVSPKQVIVHEHIKDARGVAVVVSSVPQALDAINDALKRNKRSRSRTDR